MALARRVLQRVRGLDARLVDGLLVLGFVTAIVVEFSHAGRTWLQLVPAVGTAVPLFWRRRFPIVSYLGQNAGLFLFAAPPLVSSLVAAFFGTYSMSLYSRHRLGSLSLPICQAATLAAIGIPLHFNTPELPPWLAELVVGVGTWSAGDAVRSLQLRTRRLERERELIAQVAVAEEQARIARELHDVVAHSVSIMVVQAGAARTLLAGSPERAATAMQSVEVSGREALAELRHLLGVLSDQAGEAALTAQPGLAELDGLVQRLGQAGLPVEVTRHGVPRALPPGLELTAYRIIQEALTNVLKHAGGAPTRVEIRFADEQLDIEVRNRAGGRPAPEAAGTGRGLMGMRQRLAIYGGELEAGPLPAGGFAVRARLPLARE